MCMIIFPYTFLPAHVSQDIQMRDMPLVGGLKAAWAKLEFFMGQPEAFPFLPCNPLSLWSVMLALSPLSWINLDLSCYWPSLGNLIRPKIKAHLKLDLQESLWEWNSLVSQGKFPSYECGWIFGCCYGACRCVHILGSAYMTFLLHVCMRCILPVRLCR